MFLRPARLLCLAALFLSLATPAIQAQSSWYVDSVDGSDRNSGLTAQDAFLSVDYAIQVANSGDSVLLLPGVHPAFELNKDGLTIQGEPTATVQAGGLAYAILLDATLAHFSGATVIQDLVLQSSGAGSTGVLAAGGGKVSAFLQGLQFEGFEVGVQLEAFGAQVPGPGSNGQFGGGNWGIGGGSAFLGRNRLRVLGCVFLGDGGGGELPRTAIELNCGRTRAFEGEISDSWIDGYPLGIDIWGNTTISPRIDNNDVVDARMGVRISAGAHRGGRGFAYGGSINPVDKIRILDNRFTFSSGGGGGGGGSLPPDAIVVESAGQHEVGGWIRGNQATGFDRGIYFLGGDSGGLDLPAPMSMVIRANILMGNGGGGILPLNVGIHLDADPEMELLGSVRDNDIQFFETGTWVHGVFGATFLVDGNTYANVGTEEILENTAP